MKNHVHFITAAEALELRWKILRAHLPREKSIYPTDEDPAGFHLAYKENNQVLTVATFFPEIYEKVVAKNPFRLRGMATREDFQGRGLGSIVMKKSFEILQEKKCDLLWCNARVRAIPFYSRLGLIEASPLFEMEGIGPHKVMYKRLNSL